MALDLNLGYYHIRLNEQASKLCTIILPWGKYWYKRLPMGVSNPPDISQEKINKTFPWILIYPKRTLMTF